MSSDGEDLPAEGAEAYTPVLVHRVDATRWAGCLAHRAAARRGAWVLALVLVSASLVGTLVAVLLDPSTPPAALALVPLAGVFLAYVVHGPLERWLLLRRLERRGPELPRGELDLGDWATIVRTGGLVRGQHHYRVTADPDGTVVGRVDLDTAAYRSSAVWTWDRMA